MDRMTSIDFLGKTREAPAGGSFSILRRSVTALRPPPAGRSLDPLAGHGGCRSAAGVSILLGAREGVTLANATNCRFCGCFWCEGIRRQAAGGRNGYAPLLRDRCPYPLRAHIIDLQRRAIRQSLFTCRKTDPESSTTMQGRIQVSASVHPAWQLIPLSMSGCSLCALG